MRAWGTPTRRLPASPSRAPERSYQDPFHKPELIFALTRFEGMAGFRDTAKSAEILRLLDHPWADEIAWRLESGPAFQTLRAVVTGMLSLSGHELVCLLAELGDSARRAEERGHREEHRRRPPVKDRASVDRESTRVFAQTSTLTKRYPTDPGVLVTLLLDTSWSRPARRCSSTRASSTRTRPASGWR